MNPAPGQAHATNRPPKLETPLMFAKRFLTASALLLAIGLIGLAGAGAQNAIQGRAQPTTVAVVQLARVFDELQQTTAINAEFSGRSQRLEREETDRRAEITRLENDLRDLLPGTSAHDQTQQQLAQKVIELQAWIEFQRQMLQRDHALQIEKTYRDIIGGISRVASDVGYDLVIFKPAELEFSNAKPQQVFEEIRLRPVLYARNTIDITDQIIQRMNNEYEAGSQ